MTRDVYLNFDPCTRKAVMAHLFRDDEAEHAGVLLCGWAQTQQRITLAVREFIPAVDGVDYVTTEKQHGRLQPLFIDDALTRAADHGLAYIAIHNHVYSADEVGFSKVDFASHEYGYPTLLRLNEGAPVGAAVFGTNSIEVDLWMPDRSRHQLATARVVGNWVQHLWTAPRFAPSALYEEEFDRQLPFLRAGQGIVRTTRVGVVGVGGLGSQLLEALVRIGFRHFVLIDPDHLERTNYSRVHGALPSDLPARDGELGTAKVEIGKRLIHTIAPDAIVEAHVLDVSKGDSHKHLLECDFVFLAADTAQARLTCNAVTHQYFIPLVQLGAKIQVDSASGNIQGAFGAVRHVRPGRGCLWCNGLVDRVELANAGKTQEQRDSERYGVKLPNPAVNTFNAEVAARGMNEFLIYYATPAQNLVAEHDYTLIDLLTGEREPIEATADSQCQFCAPTEEASAFGMCGARSVPMASA